MSNGMNLDFRRCLFQLETKTNPASRHGGKEGTAAMQNLPPAPLSSPGRSAAAEPSGQQFCALAKIPRGPGPDTCLAPGKPLSRAPDKPAAPEPRPVTLRMPEAFSDLQELFEASGSERAGRAAFTPRENSHVVGHRNPRGREISLGSRPRQQGLPRRSRGSLLALGFHHIMLCSPWGGRGEEKGSKRTGGRGGRAHGCSFRRRLCSPTSAPGSPQEGLFQPHAQGKGRLPDSGTGRAPCVCLRARRQHR